MQEGNRHEHTYHTHLPKVEATNPFRVEGSRPHFLDLKLDITTADEVSEQVVHQLVDIRRTDADFRVEILR